MKNNRTSLVALAAIFALPAIATHAAVIATPAGASSSLPSLSNRPIGETIHGNGLSSGGDSANILTETHSANSGNSGLYFVANGTGASPLCSLTMTFNLSAPSLVDTIRRHWLAAASSPPPRLNRAFPWNSVSPRFTNGLRRDFGRLHPESGITARTCMEVIEDIEATHLRGGTEARSNDDNPADQTAR